MIVDRCHWPPRLNHRSFIQGNTTDDEHSNRLSRPTPTFSEVGRPSSKERPLSALIELKTKGATNTSKDVASLSQWGHQLDTNRLERQSSFSDKSVDSTTALLDEQTQETQ